MIKNPTILFALLVTAIDAMGFGLIMPVMPELLRDVLGGSLARAAIWGGTLTASFAVMQFLFSPTLGAVSDRFGRRPVLVISLAVLAIDYAVMGIAWTIWMLLAARLVAGIATATQGTVAALIADISEPAEKAQNFALLGAAFGVGFVLGPAIGGVLGQFGTRAPFFAAGALALVALALGLKAMPETVTDANRRPFQWRRANPLGAFHAVATLPGVGRLLLLSFVFEFAFMVYPAIWAFFATARFGWSPSMIGLSLAAFGTSIAVVQGWLIRFVLRAFGDRGTVVFGLVFSIASMIAMGLVSQGWLALALTPLTALGIMVDPALLSMMSRRVGDDQQGELQGVLTSIGAVAMIGSPLVMTATFAAFTADDTALHLPGAPFLLGAGLVAFCLVILLVTPRARVAD